MSMACSAGHPRRSPPSAAACRHHRRTGRILSGQSTDQIMRVLEGAAAPCRWLANGHISLPSLSNDRPWDNYRHSALFAWDVRSCMILSDLWMPRYCKVNESAIDIVISCNRYEPYCECRCLSNKSSLCCYWRWAKFQIMTRLKPKIWAGSLHSPEKFVSF